MFRTASLWDIRPFFLSSVTCISAKKSFFFLFLPERIRHSGQVYSGPVIKPLRVVESSRSEMTLSLSQSQLVSTLVWRTFRSQSWRDISAFRLISRYFPKRNSKSAQKRKSNQSGNRSRSGRQGQRFFVWFFLNIQPKCEELKRMAVRHAAEQREYYRCCALVCDSYLRLYTLDIGSVPKQNGLGYWMKRTIHRNGSVIMRL